MAEEVRIAEINRKMIGKSHDSVAIHPLCPVLETGKNRIGYDMIG